MPVKVLLADDNITAQRMGCKILTDAGYSVVAVSNGAAAVKKIASERPEIAILDVYMPGYTGLEVCEKLKSSVETRRVMVLLTVTNMEPFNPEDGNRVKADGVLIKPFEPTDLLAVIRKLEEKIRPAPSTEAETTTKMVVVEEFPDHGAADWKTEAEQEAKPPAMSHDIASAPLLGIEELPVASELDIAAAPAPAPEQVQSDAGLTFDVSAPAPAFELEHVEAHNMIAPPSELEITSAPKAGELEVEPAPELEITSQAGDAEVAVVQDPALATDPSDFSEFVTKFGQEHPEDIPVGIAMEEPPQETGEIIEAIVEPEPAPQQSAAELPAKPEAVLVIDPADAQLLSTFEQEHATEISGEVATEEPQENRAVSEMQATDTEPPAQESVPEVVAVHEPEPQETAPEIGVVQEHVPADHVSDFERFVPHFDDAHGEEVPVGVVMHEAPSDLPSHDTAAEPVPVLHASGFEHQMRHVFEMSASAAMAPAPAYEAPPYEAAPEPESVPEPAAAGDTQPLEISPELPAIPAEAEPMLESEQPNTITDKLVEQFVAELNAAQQEPPPTPEPPATASAPALDKQRIADAVDRVLERYRSELTKAILRELED